MRKIDIHCHIIPGLDDGAADLNESLEMLKIAWAQGFDTFIATPHYSLHYQNLCPELIREQCSLLEEKARSAVCPEIRIYPGQEICYEDDTMKKLEQGRLLTLADSSYVLTEFPYHILFAELYRSLQRLRLEGYIPILAHAERYRSIRENEESLEELEQKNGKYLRFIVSDAPSAARLLQRRLGLGEITVENSRQMTVGDLWLDTGAAVRLLVEEGIEVSDIHLYEDTLEDYFKRITGGEGIA